MFAAPRGRIQARPLKKSNLVLKGQACQQTLWARHGGSLSEQAEEIGVDMGRRGLHQLAQLALAGRVHVLAGCGQQPRHELARKQSNAANLQPGTSKPQAQTLLVCICTANPRMCCKPLLAAKRHCIECSAVPHPLQCEDISRACRRKEACARQRLQVSAVASYAEVQPLRLVAFAVDMRQQHLRACCPGCRRPARPLARSRKAAAPDSATPTERRKPGVFRGKRRRHEPAQVVASWIRTAGA